MSLLSKNVFFFHLDDTLDLGWTRIEYRKSYEKKVKQALEKLVSQNKILVLVTHNCSPKTALERMGIQDLFSKIVSPEVVSYDRQREIKYSPRIVYYRHASFGIVLLENKASMVERVLQELGRTADEAVFFDDNDWHVDCVAEYGVESILVNDDGIDIDRYF